MSNIVKQDIFQRNSNPLCSCCIGFPWPGFASGMGSNSGGFCEKLLEDFPMLQAPHPPFAKAGTVS